MQAPRKPKEGHFTGYPMLSSPTLVECLLALGISSSIEDIEKPTAQTTISIWNSMINVFMGIQSDAYEGPKQTLLGMIEYKVGVTSVVHKCIRSQIRTSTTTVYSSSCSSNTGELCAPSSAYF